MSAPLVSVYMTVKNGRRWVSYAIESILAQTFRDWELVVVDDGSSDGTADVLRHYAGDPRVKVLLTPGIGRAPALNLALSNCRSEYVANLDADDLAHPQRLEIQYACARQYPHIGLWSTDAVIIMGDEIPNWLPVSEESIPVRDITSLLSFFNPINHSTVFARRSDLVDAGGYAPALRGQYDYDLWVRLAARGVRMAKVGLPLGAKRWHSSQSFEAGRHLRYAVDSVRIQLRANRALGGGLKGWGYALARLAWAMVPRPIRARGHRVIRQAKTL